MQVPGAGRLQATRKRQRMEPQVGGKSPSEVIGQTVPGASSYSRKKGRGEVW